MVKSGLISGGHIRPGPDMISGATLVRCGGDLSHSRDESRVPNCRGIDGAGAAVDELACQQHVRSGAEANHSH